MLTLPLGYMLLDGRDRTQIPKDSPQVIVLHAPELSPGHKAMQAVTLRINTRAQCAQEVLLRPATDSRGVVGRDVGRVGGKSFGWMRVAGEQAIEVGRVLQP